MKILTKSKGSKKLLKATDSNAVDINVATEQIDRIINRLLNRLRRLCNDLGYRYVQIHRYGNIVNNCYLIRMHRRRNELGLEVVVSIPEYSASCISYITVHRRLVQTDALAEMRRVTHAFQNFLDATTLRV